MEGLLGTTTTTAAPLPPGHLVRAARLLRSPVNTNELTKALWKGGKNPRVVQEANLLRTWNALEFLRNTQSNSPLMPQLCWRATG